MGKRDLIACCSPRNQACIEVFGAVRLCVSCAASAVRGWRGREIRPMLFGLDDNEEEVS